MAQLNQGRVDVISRDNGTLISQVNGGFTHSVMLTEPSVIKINGTREMVTEFERQGNDLILHMRDGSVVRYKQFFLDDVDGLHSELVFDDGINPPQHALFPLTSAAADPNAVVVLNPQYESLSNIDALLLADNQNNDDIFTAAGFGLLGIAGGAIAAASGGSSGSGRRDGENNNPPAPQQPTITINTFAGDNILDADEKGSSQTISGTTTNVEAGRIVTITLGGVSYTATVAANGSWSVSVPPAALQALANGNATISATVSDAAGTSASDTQAITVTGPTAEIPTITIGTFAGDNVLDADEKGSSQTISGTTTNVEAGRIVTITLGGVSYTATVAANGNWSVSVPPAALQALANGNATISATVSDAAGTSASDTQAITVTGPTAEIPTITIGTFAGDNVLDADEKGSSQTISGTTTNVEAGRIVTITLGGVSYTATVAANGNWSVSVPPAALQALANGNATISATVSDAAGTSASDTQAITVTGPTVEIPTITIGTFAGDNVLDADEKGSSQTISGTTTNVEAGSTVTITLGGVSYTATVAANGSWSVSVPPAALQALANGNATISASVSNSAGSSANDTLNITVTGDAGEPPTLSLNDFAGDNVLDGAEKQIDQTLSGTTTNVEAGRTVTITLGGVTYSALVQGDGSWSVVVPSSALAALAAGTITINASVSNAAGVSASDSSSLIVEPDTSGSIALEPISEDGYLNATEAQSPLIISGTTTGVAEGSTVTVSFNGVNYTATVGADGRWSATIPASALGVLEDGTLVVTASVSDSAGNTVTNSGQLDVVINNLPDATIDPPFGGDGVLNGDEAGSDQTISGNTGVSGPGQTVVVTLGGNDYPATVGSDGGWTVTIPAGDLGNLPQGSGNPIVVVVTDPAGNTSTSTTPVIVDTVAPALALDGPISGDGYLNAQEQGEPLIISGSGEAGAAIVVTLNGEQYSATVGSNGLWSVNVPAADLENIADGSYSVVVTATDAAGNVSSVSSPLTVIADPANQPTITLDPFAGDGVLDGAEQQVDQQLSGSTTHVQAGQVITVTLGGVNYSGVVVADGSWSVTVPASALAGLDNGTQNFSVSVDDAAGNSASRDGSFEVDNTLASLAFDPISDDGYLNAVEAQSDLTVSGTSSNVAAGSIVSFELGGNTYTATVGADGSWSATVPASVLAGLADGPLTLTATTPGPNGSTISASGTLIVAINNLPDATIDPPFGGDGVLNGDEAGSDQTISGNTGVSGPGQTVVVTLGGNDYPATVGSDGGWTVTIPAGDLGNLPQGSGNPIVVVVTDPAGNTSTSTTPVIVDTVAPALALDGPISGDGYLNAQEQGEPLIISGSGEAGAAIVVTLNGEQYSATVGSNGLWSVNVPAADLENIADGSYSVVVTATDAAGNVSSVSSPLTVIADPANQPTITLDPFAGDGVLDGAEQQVDQQLSGSTTHVQAGQVITVTLGGVNYSGVVVADGSWSVTVPASALAGLDNGTQNFSVSVDDAAGNSASRDGSFEVDNTLAALAFEPISDDGYLNAVEAQSDLTVSGTSSNVAAGSIVSFELGGNTYTATVGADGSWSATVPASVLAGLADGPLTLTATTPGPNGSTISASGTLIVAINNLPDASLDTPFTDGILNGEESQSDQTLSGNTGVTGAGQSVIVTLGGNDYPAQVNSDGSWSVQIPTEVLQALPNGSSTIVVVVSDAAGNTSTITTPVTVDTLAPQLSIEPISDDGLINANEQNQPLTIDGSAEAGATVTVTLNGVDYPAIVDNNGDWRVTIPAAVLQGLDDGNYSVTVTATDAAGNSSTQTSDFSLITAPPAFTLAPVAGDGILNSVEQGQPLTLNGTGTPGDNVSVTLNGKNYNATVAANGDWSLIVPAADLAALADGSSYTVAVTVTDAAGNTATQQSSLAVDTTAPNFTLNPVAGDGVLNASEQGEPLLISGNGSAGDSVTVTLNGKEYAATVGANGQWSVQIPPADLAALNEGDYTLSVAVSDAAGNTSTQTTPLTVDTAEPLLTVDPIAEDGVINATEQGQPLIISGTANAGDIITLTLNGQQYTATVGSNGEWSVNIPASALAAIDDGDYPLTITATNAVGNSTTDSSTLIVDTAAPALSVEPISGDGYLNSAEQGETLTVNGSGDAGDSVTVTLDGVEYPAIVSSNGQWSVDIPASALAGLADGAYTVSVTVIDAVGNTTTVTRPLTVAADPANQPTISVDPFTGDGELNGAEQGEDQLLTGTTSNVQAGQIVTVTLNGVEFTGLVQSGGGWSVVIPSSAFAGLQNSTQTFTVTVSDAAGNNASTSEQFTVDNSFSAVAIGIISGDDYLNATEAQSDLTISGSSNNVAAGSIVTVSFNNVDYSATVGADGKWSTNIPAAALAGLPDGPLTVTASVVDVNGNTVSSDTTLNVLINDLPQPTLDTPFGDGVLSGDEADTPQTLTGSTGVTGNGQSVTVNIGGVDYPATVDGDGNWTVTIPSAALQNLPDGSSSVVVTVSDIAGNGGSLTTPVAVDTTPPNIVINPISGDGLINASEQDQPLTVSGTAEAGSTVIITLNGVDYPATVAANGSWSATIPATALQALADGAWDISVTATDANGNSASALGPFTVDSAAPSFTIGTLAGDGILNASEQGQPLAISGTGTAGDSVSVTLNGTSYSATVGPNGQWSISVPASDLATLTDGSYPVSVTVSDAAGNTTTQQTSLAVDISAPALSLNTPSGDGVLNSAEQGQPLLLSGSGSAGDSVTVTLNGKTYQATVGVNGIWSLEVPATDLAALDEGANPLSVTARDAAGNSTTLQSNLTLDTGQPTLTVAVDIFAGNGIVDNAESRVDQRLTGTSTNVEAGQIVTVTLAGVSYSGVIQSSGAWSVTIPAGAMAGLSDGSQSLTVSVSNAAGNSVTVTGSYTVNTSGSSLAIEPIAGDGYLNANEQQAAIEIAGQTSNVLPGSLVQVTVNGISYNATVSADGSWTAIVPAGALAGVADGPLIISATVNDAAGNPLTATSTLNVLANPQLAVSIDPPFGDGSLNAGDVENNGTLTGSTGVSGDGQTVTVSFGGNDYSGTVASDGSWSVTIPAQVLENLQQGNTPFTVTVGDIAGNTANGSDSVLVDTLPPLLLVDTLSGDGVLNASEQGQPLPVSGSGEAGAEISVSLNGIDYTTTVAADGSWTLTIPAAALGDLADGDYNLTVIATDAAGNSSQQNSPLTVKADANNLPTISIDTFAGNNIVDGAEQQTAQTLSGIATQVEAGQTVTVTLNGQIYTAQVQPSGGWSVLIPSGALQGLADGSATITVAVSDAAGNTASNTLDIEVNSAASGLAVNTLSDDGYLNAAEALEELLISGSSVNVPQGNVVTVTFNNQTFTAEIGANGVWSVLVPPASLAGLPDGPATISVSAIDAAGNAVSSSATLNVLVNQLPDATIQPPFGDGVLNAAEAGSDQPLRGTTGVSGDGQTVSVVINGTSYSGTVDGNGNWTINLPTAVLQALAEGDSSAQVTVSDAAGNSSTIDAPFTVDREAPVLTIDTIAGDDRVNALESGAVISISGSTSAEQGQIVTVVLNGQTYSATVDASGNWSFDLPAGALAGIVNGSYTLTATVSDAAGNPVTSTSEIEVETAALVPTLDTPFTDGYLNIDEAQTTQTLSGTTGATGDGQSVVVSVGGNDYNATVDADGNWSLELDADTLQGLASGNLPIVVTATDNAGNQGTIDSNVSVDFDAPTLDINDIAGDNIINAAEAQQVVVVSGTASLSEAGQQVTVLFNGQSYQTLVQSNGSWSVNLPASALQGLADGDYPVSVSLTDAAGNSTTVEQTLTLDANIATLPTLSINAVSEDDYINQAESGEALVISGTSSNLEAGRTVSVLLNGKTYSATVDDEGNWSATVPAADVGALADGAQTITASATDNAGNPASNTHTVTVIADADSQPLLTINPVSGDDIVNAQEANSPLVISGSSQRIPDGGTVVVTLNGNSYNATVDANGNWSTTVPAADVQALDQGSNTVTASGEDIAGNRADASHDFIVDSEAPLLDITLDVGLDGILNLAEALAGLLVSGSTEAGLTVTVTLNNKQYTATADSSGDWSLTIPAGDLLLLNDGTLEVGVSVTDSAGNTTTELVDLDVAINALPLLTISTPFIDGLLSAGEAAAAQLLSGTATHLAAGTVLEISVGGLTFAGLVNADGTWSATLPAGALAGLPDGPLQLEVNATDAAGNPAAVTTTVDLLINNLPVATILPPFVDGALNAVEAGINQTINGTTGITGAGQTVTLNIDGNPFTTTVDSNGNWSTTLTPAQLAQLGNGDHTIDVVVTDRAGNSNEATLDFTAIITGLPQPTLLTPFIDGILNVAEAAAGGTLDGTSGITGEQTVTVIINGSAYQASVDEATGEWSLDLPASLLQTLPDGNWPITVSVTDSVGNVGSVSGAVVVMINDLPQPTLNLPFGDGALNIAEAAAGQLLSGKTGIIGGDQSVSVLISGFNGDNPLTATVDANGNWLLNLTPTQLATLADGPHTITVTATDMAGNSANISQQVTSALTLPDPVINLPFIDGILNIAEAGTTLTLTGSTGVNGLNQGVQLKIDVNGISYTGIVDADGNWQVAIPAGALSGLTNGTHSIIVTVTDGAGNTNTQSQDFTAALTPPLPTLALAFDDGFLNAEEVMTGATLNGTTGLTGAGQQVTVTIAGNNYDADVDNAGNWTLDLANPVLAGLAQGNTSLAVEVTDFAGNTANITSSFVVDTLAPAIAITPFTGDNTLTYLESLTTQTLSGTTSGATTGSIVTVTIGSATLTGVVQANGNWTVNVTPAAMEQLGTTSGNIGVTVSDAAGNIGNASITVAVNLTPPPATLVTLMPVNGDNIINAADGSAAVTLSGSYANLGLLGGTISVTVNGISVGSTPVIGDDGNWSINVPNGIFIDGNASVTVTAVGPGGTASTTSTLLVDRGIPTLTINAFATDDVLNSSETTVSQSISGSASTSEAGRTVNITLNGKNYSAVVQANGSWSTSVPVADLQALGQGAQTISATLSDAAGNTGSASHTIDVDTVAPLLQIDALLGDNILNALDILLTQTLTGRAPGAEGETIGLYLGDGNPIATGVVNPDGTFSIDLTPQVLGSLTEGPLVFGVRVSDEAGNRTEATLTVNKVVNSALNLVVDSVFGDGFLNAADTLVAQTISGVATSAGIGAKVELTLGGTTLSASVGQDGKWAIVVPPNLLQLLDDGNIGLNLTLTDAAGNSRTVTETVTAIVDNLPVIGNLTGLFGGDNLLNVLESTLAQTVGGVINAASGSVVTVTLGSKSYQSTVNALGQWSVTIPPLDLGALLDGTLALGVKVVDPAGNTASSSVNVGIFNTQPTISLSPIFGDGILNVADLLTGQTISGVVNHVAAGSIVTLNIGSSNVTATVGQNGAFSAVVSPNILGTLLNGNLTVGASVTDVAGNTASTSAGLVVKVTAPTVTLSPLFGDGLLNAADALLTQLIGGTVSGAEPGAKVVVNIAGQDFVTSTAANGSFGISLSPAILQGLLDGNLTVGVTVTDSAGNTGSASAGALVGIHNLPVITLNPLFGDGALNLLESLVTQTISGTIANVAAGSIVKVNIGNSTVTATVGNNGQFSAQVTPDILGTLLNGNLTVGVSVTDNVGNVSSVSAGVQVGISNPPTLTLNPIFGDGVLSAADLVTAQTISGSSTNLTAGSTVNVTFAGHNYSALVTSNGNWTLSVPKTDLATLANGTLTIGASASDAYGNIASKTGAVSIIANTPPTVSVSAVFGDGLLNAVDAQSAQTITGTSTNAEGSIISVKIGTQTFTGTIGASGSWSVSVPSASLLALADGTQTVTASVTNPAGNSGTGTGSAIVGTHTMPGVAIGSIFGGDGYLNLAEASIAETISGTSTNAAGGQISLDVAGTVYTTTVAANGNWSVNIPSSVLRSIADGSYTILATLTDAVGNIAVAGNSFTAKTHALPVIGVDPILSLVSVLVTGLTISGGTLNLAQGTRLNVTLNGSTLQASTDALGRYSVKFPGGLLTALSLSSIVTVTAVDIAGNPAATSNTLLLGSLLPAAAAESTSLFSANGEETTHGETHSLAASSSEQASEKTHDEASSATAASGTIDSTMADFTASTPVTEGSYTIGGVVITLADGSTQQGASVTGSDGDDRVAVSDLNVDHIDGGQGIDTLVLTGEHLNLDLSALGLKVGNIEVLDLGKSGTNSVRLDLNQALNLTDSPQDDLLIRGADGSQVTLSNTDGGVWATVGQRTVDGQIFDVYHNSALVSDNNLGDVLVQHNLQVHVV